MSGERNSAGAAFSTYLRENVGEVNRFLAGAFVGKAEVADLERYLYGPLAAYTENGGKRHRPLICMLAASAVGGDAMRALPFGAAIEHFQTAALIHDDIADRGQLRRGMPCMHITEGEGIAINCGDLALVTATATVLGDASLPDGLKLALLSELTEMMRRTTEGQALDLGWVRDRRFDLTCDDYLRMATLKTAFYSGAVPLACGALIGGGTAEQVEGLRAFGLETGLAFQIQDDLLNLMGDKESKDKDFRSDVTEGKRTLVAVHALEHLAAPERQELEAILQGGTDDPGKLERAVELFGRAGSIEHARARALELVRSAKARLEPLGLADGPREVLLSMADFFVERLN